LKTYLLEKSRILHQTVGERNYHIFFEIIAAVKKDPKILPSAHRWKLKSIEDYSYLNNGGDLSLGHDEAKAFHKTLKALEVIGLTLEEIDDICTLLASILALGNIQYEEHDEDEVGHLTQESIDTWLPLCADLIGVDVDDLKSVISTKVMVAVDEQVIIPLSVAKAKSARDTLATYMKLSFFG